MTRISILKTGLTALAVAIVLSAFMPAPASAQGLFGLLFGGASSRHEVAFSKRYGRGTIIISFSDRRLYKVLGNGRAISYPIGVPTGKARWQGTLHVSQKRVNPGWTPTPDMRRENPSLPAYVPGGHPRNPLGVRALYLGSTLYRIHGTDAPWTVGQNVTHGCIRMYNNDVIDLYNRTSIGTRVIATNRSFRSSY
jgi:lipoprotein-anchoring transpeptidase ErfK/SrfK